MMLNYLPLTHLRFALYFTALFIGEDYYLNKDLYSSLRFDVLSVLYKLMSINAN